MSQPGSALVFSPANGPVEEPVTKLGGQPVWLAEPQWPLSRTSGEPMEFIGQFALDGGRLAYLFMTGPDQHPAGSWNAESGENALLIQPGGRVPGFLTVRAQAEGPSAGADHLPHVSTGRGVAVLGGPGVEPDWIQGEEYPGDDWQLVVQLTDNLPFYVNFGDCGYGYAFVSPDGRDGRFLWQCS
ncbi:hypothetical protein AQ490_11950 [Wenjunlia vitaminophila]|uniref:DUF1963 domain-containing protein n=1 Tax=Wenjunlia vitaminophila TaxID=76728 RepID=A0A0T6LKS0_WENVI|nr:hypothetical protein [Wenjunlia vitaminophila]KRV46585.1 hypothetical protein AQ490_11950 [Wenjunlia vitaminophila]